MRYCPLSGSRRIYAGTGKRSLFHLMMHWIFRLPIFLTKSNTSELNTPLASIARGTNSCVCDRAAYFCFFGVAACSAAAPGRYKVDALCEVANVSGTVTSHVRHCPLAHGSNTKSSGRFPSDRRRPVGSLVDLTPAVFNARHIVSLKRLCLACLPALRRQLRPCRPLASTRAPQLH